MYLDKSLHKIAELFILAFYLEDRRLVDSLVLVKDQVGHNGCVENFIFLTLILFLIIFMVDL